MLKNCYLFTQEEQIVVLDMSAAFAADALANSHPIRMPIERPEDISQIFDYITYEKVFIYIFWQAVIAEWVIRVSKLQNACGIVELSDLKWLRRILQAISPPTYLLAFSTFSEITASIFICFRAHAFFACWKLILVKRFSGKDYQ